MIIFLSFVIIRVFKVYRQHLNIRHSFKKEELKFNYLVLTFCIVITQIHFFDSGMLKLIAVGHTCPTSSGKTEQRRVF